MGSAPVSKMARKRLLDLLDGTRCYYCRCKFSVERYRTIEHIVPVSRGGSKHDSNLAWTCSVCNFEKDCMTGREYMDALGFPDQLTRLGSYANVAPMECFYVATCSGCLGDFPTRDLKIRYCSEGCRLEMPALPRAYKIILFEAAEYGLLI